MNTKKCSDIDVELAVRRVHNKFDLILIAAARARELGRGREPLVNSRAKPPATALLEIQEGLVGADILRRIVPRRSKK